MVEVVDHYVGDRIRRARIEAGLTQSQLATATGTSFQQLQKYERGDNRVSASRLYALCSVLQVDVATMFPPMPGKGEVVPLEARRPRREIEHMYEALAPDDRKVVMSVLGALLRKDSGTEVAA